MKKSTVALGLFLITLMFNASAGAEAMRDHQSSKTWSVLLFIEASDDLKPYALHDLAEIKAAMTSLGSQAPQFFAEFDDLSSDGADPDRRLGDFLKRVDGQITGENTLLILWGHGRGWKLTVQTSSLSLSPVMMPAWLSSSVSPDEFQVALSLSKIGRTLLEETQRTGRKFDVIAFDACLMQTVEVADELSGAASYIVGSEQVFPYSGLPYARLIESLSDSSSLEERVSPRKFAAALPELARRAHLSDRDAPWFTMSTVSLDALKKQLVPALGDLGAELSSLAKDDVSAIRLQRVLQGTPRFAGGYKDVKSFIEALTAEIPSLRDETLDRVRIALKNSVIASVQGSQYGGQDLGGVSVWLPETEDEYVLRRDDFSRSRFYSELKFETGTSSWRAWLDALYGVGQ